LACGSLCLAALSLESAEVADSGHELTPAEREAGFVSMFNGTDFTGWRFEGKESPPRELCRGPVFPNDP
jgi:hypothetical protein